MTAMRGWTLIEMLLVLTIVGVVAALVVPRLLGGAERARHARALADLQTLSQALERYRLDAGAYPTTAQGLAALAAEPAAAPRPLRWRAGGYLPRVPRDPWGKPYLYARDGNRYLLRSLGADHAPGGSGEASDVDAALP